MSNACIGTFRTFLPLAAKPSSYTGSARRSQLSIEAVYWRPSLALRRSLFTAQAWRDPVDGNSPRSCRFCFFSRPFHTTSSTAHPLPPRRSSTPSSKPQSKSRKPSPIATTPSSSPSLPAFDSLTRADLRNIFSTDLPQEEGIHILRTLHNRRLDGSLIDTGVQIPNITVASSSVLRALKWLRQKYPLDEQTAATAYSEREAQKVSNSYIARAERLGFYKPPEGAPAASDAAGEYSSVNVDRSVLEDFKLYHEERRQKEEEEKERSGENARNQELRIAKLEERQKAKELREQRTEEYRQKMTEKSYASPFKEIPEMTKLARLGPSTIFCIATTIALITYSYTYTPPLRSSRVFPELPMSIATYLGIGISCLAVTFLWHVPPMWRLFNRYFVVSTAWPYVGSLLGNIFSHQTFTHLGTNMLGALIFAIPVHEEIGRGNFLGLWTSSGVLGALASMYYFTFTNRLGFYHFGCSGAIWGVLTSWVYFDQRKAHDPDDPNSYLRIARYVFAGILTLGNFGTGIIKSTDVVAHAGGGLVGLVWAAVLAWRADSRKKVTGRTPAEERQWEIDEQERKKREATFGESEARRRKKQELEEREAAEKRKRASFVKNL